jgi:hypothetical protein
VIRALRCALQVRSGWGRGHERVEAWHERADRGRPPRHVTETDVTLTDFALAAECAVFALACARRPRTPLRDALSAAYALSGVAAVCGAAVHGFASDAASIGYRVLWPLTLLAIMGASAALASGAVILSGAGARWRHALGLAALALGAGVLAGADSFALAVAAYAPASLALACAFAMRFLRHRDRSAAYGSAGLLLGIGAGGLQQLGFTPAPGALSHNAFYHVLQMIALALLYVAARGPSAGPAQPDA